MKKGVDYLVNSLKRYLILFLVFAGFILFFTFANFETYYKGTYNGNFIGYYKTIEDFSIQYDKLANKTEEDGVEVKKYYNRAPTFDKMLVKNEHIKQNNNKELIEKQFTKEYIVYAIKINDKNEIYVKSKDIAEKTVKEITNKVKSTTKIKIKKLKTTNKAVISDGNMLEKQKKKIIEKNKKIIKKNISSRSGTTRISINKNNKYIWPTTSKRITSYYGPRKGKTHTGLDIGVASNSPIYAVESGTVILACWNGGYGYQVKIQHSNGVITTYAHNSKLLVKKGEKVKQGQIITRSGSTGNSTGPHLHIEFIVNGKFQNPLNYL